MARRSFTLEFKTSAARLVREQGYSVNDEEDELGVRAVGAPILSADGVAIAAISVVGTTGQLTLDRVTATGRAVREAALEISIHMQKLHVLA